MQEKLSNVEYGVDLPWVVGLFFPAHARFSFPQAVNYNKENYTMYSEGVDLP